MMKKQKLKDYQKNYREARKLKLISMQYINKQYINIFFNALPSSKMT